MALPLKFAAIDIGSNAVRLLFTNVFETDAGPVFRKSELIRVPVRLGEGAFTLGHIPPDMERKLTDTMKAFKLLIGVHGAVAYRACATSAMRNSRNGEEIAERISEEAGIDIEIVSGKVEADIIFSNHIEDRLYRDRSYLYIDVGGGSTELTVFSDNRPMASRSFRIGTIRLLAGKVEPEYWERVIGWVRENTQGLGKMDGIGSGGNINKLYKMAALPQGQPLSLQKLGQLYAFLSAIPYEKRIYELGLNPDRADVIIPACEIFIKLMETAGIKDIIVPQFGLSDGITRQLYERYADGRGILAPAD